MKIKKFILDNVGIYSGKNIFDLEINSKNKNIILIGGKNGGGKTTFFESLKLCLYGKNSFDKVISKEAYESYLKSKIHKNPNLGVKKNYASIIIEFEYSHQSLKSIYEVKRNWEINYRGNIDEYFEVKRNGELLKNLQAETWQEFINDLIPKGLIELFFFDGEKIQNLVDDHKDTKELSNSFKALLGLEVVEKLISDLEIYESRQLKLENKTSLGNDLESIGENIQEIENKYEEEFQNKALLITKKESLEESIKNLELELQREGGTFAQKRELLKKDILLINNKLEDLENNFRILLSQEAPLVLLKKHLKYFEVELFKENEYNKKKVADDILKQKFIEIKKSLKEKLKQSDLNKIKSILDMNLEKRKMLFNLSDSDFSKLSQSFKNLKNKEKQFFGFSESHNILSKKLNLAQKELSYAPEDEVISPILTDLSLKNKELGVIESEIEDVKKSLNQFMLDIDSLKNRKQQISKEIKQSKKYSEKLDQIFKVKNSLERYNKQLSKVKLEEFCEVFIGIYNKISRKSEKFDKVEIDEKTFEVTLVKTYEGESIKTPKRELSEGEKQMYALSVLWTLTKLSKRPLPFVIDTPLGRLDHSHREKLINSFFPEISKQLIILSTDSEIDEKYFNLLRKNVEKSYLLNENNGSTKIKKGYFF